MIYNLGNAVGLLVGTTPPAKKYILWGKVLDSSFPNEYVVHRWDNAKSDWIPVGGDYFLDAVINQLNTPPVSPAAGDTYLVGSGPSGVWAGHANQHAQWTGHQWYYITPTNGTIAYKKGSSLDYYQFDGSVWLSANPASGDYIPLAGTDSGAPVSGPVEMGAAASLYGTDGAFAYEYLPKRGTPIYGPGYNNLRTYQIGTGTYDDPQFHSGFYQYHNNSQLSTFDNTAGSERSGSIRVGPGAIFISTSDVAGPSDGISLSTNGNQVVLFTSMLTGSHQVEFQDKAGTFAYLDDVYNAIAGLNFKLSVHAASTANVNIASAPSALDGVTMVSGRRYLLKDQTTQSQNGIYIFNGVGVAMTRSDDADTGTELANKTVPVDQGIVNADTWWTIIQDTITIGVTNITLTQTGGGGLYNAGTGLQLSGNTFSIATNGVTDSLLRQGIATSVIGRSGGTLGNVADIQASADGQILSRLSGALGFNTAAAILGYTPADDSTVVHKTGNESIAGVKTFTNDINFSSAKGIKDANGAYLISFPSTVASAVNYIQVSNAATAIRPSVSAIGSDTNIGIDYVTKGSGKHTFTGNLIVPAGTGSTDLAIQIGTNVGTGIYSPSANAMYFCAGGSPKLQITTFAVVIGGSGLTLVDGLNVAMGNTTGSYIARSTDKMAFWGATPTLRLTTAVSAATLVSNAGTPLTDTDTFDGYTIAQIVKILRTIGLVE